MEKIREKIMVIIRKVGGFFKEASKNKKVFIPSCIAISCAVLAIAVILCVSLGRRNDVKQTELNGTQDHLQNSSESEHESPKESESETVGESETGKEDPSHGNEEPGNSVDSGENGGFWNGNEDDTDSDSDTYNHHTSDIPATSKPDDELKTRLSVTICTPVSTGISIVGGICSGDAEAIHISGANIEDIDIYPDYNDDGGYFIGQVKSNANCNISVCEVSGGERISQVETKSLSHRNMSNLMESDEYMPVFGKNSRMHFYSSILTYTRSGFISDGVKNVAKNKMTKNVNTVRDANPNAELIYLVIPSSAWVYPETVPDEYPEASGETLYEAFRAAAEQSGAKVIYPIDLFREHKNDGSGYKIYHNTDSHWTTYGAYWGMYSLMSYISGKYPAAAPRSYDYMGFYTTQLYGGDSLFSFGDNGGFENLSLITSDGRTLKTKISEKTTLYSRNMPTNTLYDVYRGNASTYVSGNNGIARTEINPAPAGLPSAVVIRDSFGCTVYDMFNDRFSKVCWQGSHNYKFPAKAVSQNSPDYVIYIVSERNLLKVMLEDGNADICS